jgi:hypothetical protein
VALFALAAVGLAVGAHLAGDEPVPTTVALAAVPAVMIVMNLLAGRRRGPTGLFAVMGLVQVVLHLAFMLAAGAEHCTAVGMHAMPGAHPGTPMAVSCEPAMLHEGMSGQLRPSPVMALGHILATVLVVLLLARGEAAIWALAATVRRRIVLPGQHQALQLPAARRLPVTRRGASLPRCDVSRRWVRRRGPPRLARAVT